MHTVNSPECMWSLGFSYQRVSCRRSTFSVKTDVQRWALGSVTQCTWCLNWHWNLSRVFAGRHKLSKPSPLTWYIVVQHSLFNAILWPALNSFLPPNSWCKSRTCRKEARCKHGAKKSLISKQPGMTNQFTHGILLQRSIFKGVNTWLINITFNPTLGFILQQSVLINQSINLQSAFRSGRSIRLLQLRVFTSGCFCRSNTCVCYSRICWYRSWAGRKYAVWTPHEVLSPWCHRSSLSWL